jgi:predicted Zn-dependent protease
MTLLLPMRSSIRMFLRAALLSLFSCSLFAAGWNLPENSAHSDWSDYTEASPDLDPDAWSVPSLADFDGHEIQLRSSNDALLRWVDVEQLRILNSVYHDIERVSETRSALYITRGDTPNASAGQINEQNIVFVNFAMFDLIDGDPNLWAALLGHEIAHLKLKHGETQAKKNMPVKILKAVGNAVLNNPLANIASSALLDSFSAKFGRDDERQSDYMGVIWAVEADYDSHGAAQLHRQISERSRGHPIPFLSSHPSSPKRIEALEALGTRLSK